MVHQKSSGFTLIELMVIVAIICTLFALILPQIASHQHPANRAYCASNLQQIGTALNLYESIPAYNCFPVDSSNPDPLKSLGILYRDFVADARVFSCASHPTLSKLVGNLQPGSKNPVDGNLDASMSGFGYDPGYGTPNVPHNSGDATAVVAADILNGGTRGNSNVSANHKSLGINVLLASGSVEWHETNSSGLISNVVSIEKDKAGNEIKIIDPDIYTGGGITDPASLNLESNVRP